MTAETAEIANRHWFDSYEAFVTDLGGEFRRFGSVGAFLGGIPLPFANGCLVLWPADPADLDAAIQWVSSAQVPHVVRVEESLVPEHAGVISSHGLERDPEPMPGMVMQPIPPSPAPAPGVTVERVDFDSYKEFVEVLIVTGLPDTWAERTFGRHLLDREDLGYFLARLEGQPVGTSVAVRTNNVGGIYSVGTAVDARRRGVGTAVTWAAIDAIRGWGCEAVVLQASAMGYPVYRSMGFEEIVRYARFKQPPDPRQPPEPNPTA